MADAEKLKKLAAGRKKLKNYQQEKNKGTKKHDTDADDTHSVSSGDNQPPNQEPSEFSERFVTKEPFHNPPNINAYFFNQPTSEVSASSFFDEVTPRDNPTEVAKNLFVLYNNGDEFAQPTDVAMEDPEINPNEIFDRQVNVETNENSKPAEFTPQNENEIYSTTETLRQLSSQITQLIEPSYDNQNNFSDLEKRNLELASLYETEKIKSGQTQVELEHYKSRIVAVEKQWQNLKDECENRIKRELGPLQEQLQCHMQTVGILVGEKTELTAALNQCQVLNRQKTDECEDLQARLKTSRSRVIDFEKELGKLKEERNTFNQLGSQQNEEQLKLQSELGTLRENNVEAQQDITELREKLKFVTNENTQLQQSVKDANSQLSLANVKIQQLTVGESSQDGVIVDNLMEEKLLLEKQVADLNSTVKNAISDRDQASNHYQQYVQQLNTNVTSLAQKLEFTVGENENLMRREQELVKHVGELEKRLQSLQNERVNFNSVSKIDNGKKELENDFENLQNKHEALEVKFNELIGERDDLLREVESRKESVIELENTVERLQGNQTDSTRLLATIESDKVAASRAVQQNSQLKQQLEEMQEAFIKMTNDKAELMDKITTEQYKLKDLEDKLQLANHQLHTLTEAITIKDHELMEMRENSTNLSKQVMQQNQLADRLRHYEAHEHSSQVLVNDLQDAVQEIEALKLENKHLKDHDHHEHDDHDHHDHDHHDHDHEYNDDKMEESLQNEIFNLKEVIEKLQIENNSLRNNLVKVKDNDPSETVDNVDVITDTPDLSNSHLYDLNQEMAMRQLEAKFMRTMQDIANLQDEKQKLEHLVLQLQGETETIGEYITLYQHQRGVLKQRAQEKELQLNQLAKDREIMRQQLNQLNDLVRRLISEQGAPVSSEFLQQHEALQRQTNELCDEHAKLHDEMKEEEAGQQTADKIIALLSEIKSCNLVQPIDVSETFHPCPLCSGKLITV